MHRAPPPGPCTPRHVPTNTKMYFPPRGDSGALEKEREFPAQPASAFLAWASCCYNPVTVEIRCGFMRIWPPSSRRSRQKRRRLFASLLISKKNDRQIRFDRHEKRSRPPPAAFLSQGVRFTGRLSTIWSDQRLIASARGPGMPNQR